MVCVGQDHCYNCVNFAKCKHILWVSNRGDGHRGDRCDPWGMYVSV